MGSRPKNLEERRKLHPTKLRAGGGKPPGPFGAPQNVLASHPKNSRGRKYNVASFHHKIPNHGVTPDKIPRKNVLRIICVGKIWFHTPENRGDNLQSTGVAHPYLRRHLQLRTKKCRKRLIFYTICQNCPGIFVQSGPY